MENIFYHNVREKKNEIILCNILSNSSSVVIFHWTNLRTCSCPNIFLMQDSFLQ